MQTYKGMIVEESLIDNRVLNSLEIIGFSITDDQNPEDRWHIYTVYVTANQIELLSKYIKSNWYMHFWDNDNIIVVFENKIFEFDISDTACLNEVIEYGICLGIPKEQLDFARN